MLKKSMSGIEIIVVPASQITRWEWTRMDTSPAAGDVVGDTRKEPVLYLVNAVPGQYTYQLRVFDDQAWLPDGYSQIF